MIIEMNNEQITMTENILDLCLPNSESDDDSFITDCSGDSLEYNDIEPQEDALEEQQRRSTLSLTSGLLLSSPSTHNIDHRKCTPTTTSIIPPIDFENSFANSPCVRKVLTGVIVKGFHPQLCNWKENSSKGGDRIGTTTTAATTTTTTTVTNYTPHDVRKRDNVSCNSKSNQSENRSISNACKRRRLSNGSLQETITEQVSSARSQTKEMNGSISQWGKTELKILTSCVCSQDEKPTALEIYSDVFEHSTVAQVIAAPGGRIAAWNKEFSNLFSSLVDTTTKPPLNTLTAFDVVEPTMIPKLYEIFLIALQEDLVKEHENVQENEEVKYLSLCVPCIRDFGTEEKHYFITFSLMNDDDFAKRCFHCIISSQRPQRVGEIFSISQNTLMEML